MLSEQELDQILRDSCSVCWVSNQAGVFSFSVALEKLNEPEAAKEVNPDVNPNWAEAVDYVLDQVNEKLMSMGFLLTYNEDGDIFLVRFPLDEPLTVEEIVQEGYQRKDPEKDKEEIIEQFGLWYWTHNDDIDYFLVRYSPKSIVTVSLDGTVSRIM